MNKSSTSVLAFGVYLIGMGLGLVFMPNTVLGILGFPATSEVWINVVGVLALVLAYYYIQAGRADDRGFAGWTVHARIGVFVAFTAFALLGKAGMMMIGLGLVDLLGALWTGWALRNE